MAGDYASSPPCERDHRPGALGDHCEGIGKINIMLGDEPLLKPLSTSRAWLIGARCCEAPRLVHPEGSGRGHAIALRDDELDGLYDKILRELLNFMIQDRRRSPGRRTPLGDPQFEDRDRVTNICERVIFAVTGRMEETNVSKY